MKRITYKIIIIGILLIANMSAFAQTYYLNGTTGNFSAKDSVYFGPKTIIWYIDMGTSRTVKIDYDIDVAYNTDYVDIYAISSTGNEYWLQTFTGPNYGSITIPLSNGKAKVQFRMNVPIYFGNNYRGLVASFSEGSAAMTSSEVNTSVSDNAYVNNNMSVLGNVGIGAFSSSSSRLWITGNNQYGIFSSNSGTNSTYGIYSSNSSANGNAYGIYSLAAIGNSNSSNVYGIYSIVNGPAGNKWAGYFTGGNVQVNSGNLITTNGKVGIGTTTPQNALDVFGNVYLPANNSYWIGSYSDSGNRLRLHHNGYNAYIDYMPNLYFRADGTAEALTLLQNGNVGIGVANPQNKLEINGNIKASALSLDGSCEVVGSGETGSAVSIVNSDKTDSGQAREWKIYNMTGGYGNSLQFWAYDAVNGCDNGGCNSRLTIMDNGNVGIGVWNPANKLDVNGIIRAKEVKIETDWADFVFKDNYLLKPLREVKEYIKVNKRLPDLPSEQEVKENGVNLGDIQTKLLQKIEELTLYTIQQQEMIDKLNARIEQLEKK